MTKNPANSSPQPDKTAPFPAPAAIEVLLHQTPKQRSLARVLQPPVSISEASVTTCKADSPYNGVELIIGFG